jgi:lipoprotein signal peptidase
VKQAFPADELYLHARSQLWVALSIAVLAGSVALSMLPSRFVAVASGVLAGGVLGNLVWARWHNGVVANPFVVTSGATEVAFNLADVFVLAGILLEMAALIVLTIRYRHLLPPGRASRAR